MCGIAGVVDRKRRGRAIPDLAEAMLRPLVHRGPDAQEVWVSPDRSVCFAHTRLAVIDLSPAGSQPMHSLDGRYVLVFNGEIYNHADVRAQLPPTRYRGHCDTEVLLEALRTWGVDRTLERLNGMFAFALWDARDDVLTVARDRIGEKPLYFAVNDDFFAFASDLAALRELSWIDWSIDRDATAEFLKRGYVSRGRSIYAGVSQLRPASVGHLRIDDCCGFRSRRYWWPGEATPSVARSPEARSEQVEELLRESIKMRTLADVPVGAFLSGGIDSSLVVALMRESSGSVRTFSIGFHEADMDEAPFARRMAEHLGTDHTEMYLDSKDALAVVPLLPAIYTEPFADPSQIPTALVCTAARRHVTVCLSGDGGDELFAGYDRYARTVQLWRRFGSIPVPLRRLASAGIRRLEPATWARLLRPAYRATRRRAAPADLGHKVRRLGEVLSSDGVSAVYDDLFSLWQKPADIVRGAHDPGPIGGPWSGEDAVPWMTSADLDGYLPDDILVKVDRAAMAVGLETRVPMLDHRLVELALALPAEDKLVDGIGKQILRRVLARHVPADLFERPKQGFGAPIDRWLRGPLRSWAEELLEPSALAADELLDPEPIRARWREHLSGERNWQYSLWAVLMLQQWRERWTR